MRRHLAHCETPLVSIPLSAENPYGPYPHGRVRVFMGKGMGSPENTWGLHMTFTSEPLLAGYISGSHSYQPEQTRMDNNDGLGSS
jgi:hypothetical protein